MCHELRRFMLWTTAWRAPALMASSLVLIVRVFFAKIHENKGRKKKRGHYFMSLDVFSYTWLRKPGNFGSPPMKGGHKGSPTMKAREQGSPTMKGGQEARRQWGSTRAKQAECRDSFFLNFTFLVFFLVHSEKGCNFAR